MERSGSVEKSVTLNKAQGSGLRRLAYRCRAGAQRDLARYLHLSPEAKDAAELREQLVELNAVRTSRMH